MAGSFWRDWPPPYAPLQPETLASYARFLERFEALTDTTTRLTPQALAYIKTRDFRSRARGICQMYWVEKRHSDLPLLASAKPHARNISRKLDALIKAVQDAPLYVNTAIFLESGERVGTSETIQDLLAWQVASEKISNLKGKTGPDTGDHLDRTVHRLASLWWALTGTTLGITLATIEEEGERVFQKPAPYFVTKLIQAIDDTLTLAEIGTTIRKGKWKAVQSYTKFLL